MRATLLLIVLVVLLPGCLLFELSVSRDGVIAVGDGQDLVLIPAGGGPARRIPLGLEVIETAWSPDGTTVAVAGRRGADAAELAPDELWFVARDGAARRLRRGALLRPAWSPDGRRIALLAPADTKNRPATLEILDAASGRTTATLAGVVAFDWHPGGQRVAVISIPPDRPLALGGRPVSARLEEVTLVGPAPARRTLHRFDSPVDVSWFPGGVRYARGGGPRSAPDRILFIGHRSSASTGHAGLYSLDLARSQASLLGGEQAPGVIQYSLSPSRTRVVALAGEHLEPYRVSLDGTWTRVGMRRRRYWGTPPPRTDRLGILTPAWISEHVLAIQVDAWTIARLDLRDGQWLPLYSQLYRPVRDAREPLKRTVRPPRPPQRSHRIQRPAHPVVAKLGPFVELVRQRWQRTLDAPPTGLWTAGDAAVGTTEHRLAVLDGETGRVRRTDRLRAPQVGPPFRMGGALGTLDATGRLVGLPVRQGREPALGLVPSSPALSDGPFVYLAVQVGSQHQFGAFHARDYRWRGRYVLDAPLAGPPVETHHQLFVLTRKGTAMGFDTHAGHGLVIRWRRRLPGLRLVAAVRPQRLWLLRDNRVIELDADTGILLGRVGPGWSKPRLVTTHGGTYVLGLDGETPCLGRLKAGAPLAWRREHVDRLVAANATRLYAMSGRTLLELDASTGQLETQLTLPPEVVHVAGGPDGPGEPLLLGLADGTVIRLDISE